MRYISYIAGIALFFILLGSEMAFVHMYSTSSVELHRLCIEHMSETTVGVDICSQSTSAATSAFSSATATHIGSYFVIFVFFLILLGRLDKMESRIKQLEVKS